MKTAFRWYGAGDPVSLDYIRQIPGMKGVVTSLADIPPGEVWPLDAVLSVRQQIERRGLQWLAVESLPVHESIKLGLPEREEYIANYITSLRHLGEAGISVVCYNFMPVFDWFRTDLSHPLADGSFALAFDSRHLHAPASQSGAFALPGWGASYSQEKLQALLTAFQAISESQLWEHLAFFIQAVLPVAESLRIKMAIHPDDPPWSLFGIPRIMSRFDDLERLCDLYDSPYNTITFCSGSLGASASNELPALIHHFGKERNRIGFVHLRNVRRTENGFEETAHLSECGSLDLYDLVRALLEAGFDGPFRPDHGRAIWGETGNPGYGLYDRALGAVYINGLTEAILKGKSINRG